MSEKKALVGNAADPEQVKEAKRKELSLRDQELVDVRELLQSHAGRRFFWRYLTIAGIYETTFRIDPHAMSFYEGQRSVGLRLLADITEADAQSFVTMMTEHKKNG